MLFPLGPVATYCHGLAKISYGYLARHILGQVKLSSYVYIYIYSHMMELIVGFNLLSYSHCTP